MKLVNGKKMLVIMMKLVNGKKMGRRKMGRRMLIILLLVKRIRMVGITVFMERFQMRTRKMMIIFVLKKSKRHMLRQMLLKEENEWYQYLCQPEFC